MFWAFYCSTFLGLHIISNVDNACYSIRAKLSADHELKQ